MIAPTGIWIDGEPATALPLPDRGLEFGDGLFETLLLRRGQLLFSELHLQRLQAGLQVLGFPDCLEQARRYLVQAAAQLDCHKWAALRLTLTRGSAPRGYAPPAQVHPRVVISAAAIPGDRRDPAAPARLEWARIRWSSQPLLAGIKHLNRLEQVMAAAEAQRHKVDEVLVLDQQGHVSSVSAGNIFLLSNGRLLTPALESCGIAGTRRRLVMEQWGPAIGLAVEQAHISPEQFESAEEVFYCNSLQGLRPIASIAGIEWREHTVCRALHQCFLESLPC